MSQYIAPDRSSDIAQVRAALLCHTQQAHGEAFTMLEGLKAGLEAFPPERVFVADMTLLGYACAQYLPNYQPRTFIHPAEFCTIGCGLPLAIGAQVAAPDQPVIAVCGDGGFLLNASELATAVQEKLPVIVIIFNDSTYSTVKKDQQRRFGHYIATDLVAPDYVALAHAFHAHSLRVESPAELACAVCEAKENRGGPTVIEVTLPAKEW